MGRCPLWLSRPPSTAMDATLHATMPGYLVAYTYTDFLEYAGPVQML